MIRLKKQWNSKNKTTATSIECIYKIMNHVQDYQLLKWVMWKDGRIALAKSDVNRDI